MCELAAETSLRSIPGTFGRLVKRSFSVSTVWTRIGRIGDAAVYKLTLRYVRPGRGDCGARCTVTCVAWTQIKRRLERVAETVAKMCGYVSRGALNATETQVG